jgi:hypothetical protein
MKIKRSFYLLVTVFIFLISAGGVSVAAPNTHNPDTQIPTSSSQEISLKDIVKRVEEIKAMDKSQLTPQQRKELRKELRAMKKQARVATGGGVYLSVGAILLIVLALIILL